MSFHQPLPLPAAFPRVRAGLRRASTPLSDPTVHREPPHQEAQPDDTLAAVPIAQSAEDAPSELRARMLSEIELALESEDPAAASFHVELATLYARRLVASRGTQAQ